MDEEFFGQAEVGINLMVLTLAFAAFTLTVARTPGSLLSEKTTFPSGWFSSPVISQV